MSEDDPDITDPTDVARLAFGNEDGVVWGDLTWQSYVDTHDDGTITVDVYPDTNPLGERGDIPGLRYRVEYIGHAPDPGDQNTGRA
ncbi:hypothetical protein [Amycolatopsis magusensis]|uniref:Uncharacterized protein n=1 Tax=Amycolatopsis magusensis TaxID=882444 RepID=A0ABS4PWT9_9PSEU|nr:hypothetical protein [Amycolatopsis magusensis]MBP2183897.1 hypothetical protein [Amycolatopsis magusensis]